MEITKDRYEEYEALSLEQRVKVIETDFE